MKEIFEREWHYLYTNEVKTLLLFVDIFGNHELFLCSADCCSDTWIENINNIEALLDNKIIGIEIKEYPDINPVKGKDFITRYGYTLKTSKGHCDIEFRNESNGYYGGSLDYIEKKDYQLYIHPTENVQFIRPNFPEPNEYLYIGAFKKIEREKLSLWKNK